MSAFEQEQLQEVEVFRCVPIINNYYETAHYTRVEGKQPNQKYFTTNKLEYVGIYVREIRYGYGDGGSCHAVFNNNGVEKIVPYTYEGTTCFREIKPYIVPRLEQLSSKVVTTNYDLHDHDYINDIINRL
jgi:hypothetical protein